MNYCSLGRTGLKVSELCLGTMQWGWTADEAASGTQPQRFAQAAISSAARLVQPVPRSELEQVVSVWVDRALSLDDRGRAWMKRLFSHQSITFAKLKSIPLADISRAA